MNITHLIENFGYWALFALVAVESLGVPLPGETALIIGDNIGYWLGDKGGMPSRAGTAPRCDWMSRS